MSKGVNKNDILNDFWRIGQLPAKRISEIFLEGEKPVGVVHQLMAKCWLRFLEEADASVLFKFADYLIGRGDKVKVAKMVGSVGAVYDAHEVDATFSGVGGGGMGLDVAGMLTDWGMMVLCGIGCVLVAVLL